MDKASRVHLSVKGVGAEKVTVEVKEDDRLFWTPPRGGKKVRMFTWLPWDERYWPGEKNGDITLGDGITVLMLRRSYNPKHGRFEYSLDPAKKLEGELHPSNTKAFVGFMLIGPDAAMASLLIPASAKNPID